MSRSIVIPLAATVAGLVWVFTLGTLFGALLVIGGITALLVPFLPAALERIGRMLAAGQFRDE